MVIHVKNFFAARFRVNFLLAFGVSLVLFGFTVPSKPTQHPTNIGDITREALYIYDPYFAGASSGTPNVVARGAGTAGCSSSQALGLYNDGGSVGLNCLSVDIAGGPTGAWQSEFVGLVGEGANGEGAFYATATAGGSKFRNVVCTCRVTGTGGTNGIFVALIGAGSEVTNCELAGGDSNACDDTAGTVLRCDVNTTIAATTAYTLQFKSTTDCATNPTDCGCNVVIEQ